jgi:hypothetical protein
VRGVHVPTRDVTTAPTSWYTSHARRSPRSGLGWGAPGLRACASLFRIVRRSAATIRRVASPGATGNTVHGASDAEEPSYVRSLSNVLETVVGDADEAHAESDGWIPPPVHNSVEVCGREVLQHCARAAVDGVEVLQQYVRLLRSNGRDVLGAVAVPSVRRVRIEPETTSPVAAGPDGTVALAEDGPASAVARRGIGDLSGAV